MSKISLSVKILEDSLISVNLDHFVCQSWFLEALLVRQSDGELKNVSIYPNYNNLSRSWLSQHFLCYLSSWNLILFQYISHGLRMPWEKIAFTARPKIQSQSKIFRYDRRIFCLPHRPKISDFFDLWLHWMSVVRVVN